VDPIVATNCQYALALWYLGDVQRARATIEASLAATDHPGTAAITRAAALCHMAVFAMLCRDPSDARRHAGAMLALTSEHEFHFWGALAKGLLGWVHVQDGDLRQGIETLMAARDEIAASGARILATYILAFLAEAHLCTRDLAAGLAAVDEGLHVAESSLDRSYWPELWRLKGELLLATAPPRRQRRTGPIRRDDRDNDCDWREAEHCFTRALELARESDAKSLELRAATSLARAWQARRRAAEARRLLAGTCTWFADAPATADLLAARDVLSRLPTGVRSAAK